MKIFKIIVLGPLSLLFDFITRLRNYLFDKNILKSLEPNIFSLGIGNITVGGTGKTPMVLHISKYFSENNIAILSRGYGRTSKGFFEIQDHTPSNIAGDEPKLIKLKSKNNIKVYVGENRINALQKIQILEPETKLLILDDVFQHRKIKPKVLILLINYNQLIYNDYLLPYGRLRESINGINRAQIIVITKTPNHLENSEKSLILNKIRSYTTKKIPTFFSKIKYGNIVNYLNNPIVEDSKTIVISAIANNDEFYNYLKNKFFIQKQYAFPDHYVFEKKLILGILKEYQNMPIICTEKDYVKLIELVDESQKPLLFYVPISNEIDNEVELKDMILTSFNEFLQNQQSN